MTSTIKTAATKVLIDSKVPLANSELDAVSGGGSLISTMLKDGSSNP
jgi:hypothetical protein